MDVCFHHHHHHRHKTWQNIILIEINELIIRFIKTKNIIEQNKKNYHLKFTFYIHKYRLFREREKERFSKNSRR